MTVEGQSLVTNLRSQSMSVNQFLESADMTVIDDTFRRAALCWLLALIRGQKLGDLVALRGIDKAGGWREWLCWTRFVNRASSN
jgi:hypothetical protein